MDLSQAPAFVAVKLAMLSDACATATMRADELTAQIADLRDRLNGRVVRAGDHPEKLRIELEQRLEEQKALQRQRPIEADISAAVGRGWRTYRRGPCLSKSFLTLRLACRSLRCGPVPRNSRIKLRR